MKPRKKDARQRKTTETSPWTRGQFHTLLKKAIKTPALKPAPKST